jgi:hypothetical protein
MSDQPDALSDGVGGRQGWQSSQDGKKLHDGRGADELEIRVQILNC